MSDYLDAGKQHKIKITNINSARNENNISILFCNHNHTFGVPVYEYGGDDKVNGLLNNDFNGDSICF